MNANMDYENFCNGMDYVESIIEDLIESYENMPMNYEGGEYRREGAIDALDYLLSIIKGN